MNASPPGWLATFTRALVPLVCSLVAGAVILALMGKNPFVFYGDIVFYGIAQNGWQKSLSLMAPLTLMALGLIVVFRGKLWNLGYDGQFLLGAALVAGVGPAISEAVPFWLALPLLCLLGAAVGAAWALVPAVLKARFGTNEIITTLMMSFIGIGIANLLVRGVFQDPGVIVPQTRVLPIESMLPYIPGTRIHVGLIVALAAAAVLYLALTKSSFGLRLDVYGENPRAAAHAGIHTGGVIVVVFLLSGALFGLAAGIDITGQWGYMRANWNPSYGAAILPFVFLARLNPLGALPLVAFYSVLATGGTVAAQESDLSVDFLMVIIALILVFMTLIELWGSRRQAGASYLPPALMKALRVGSRQEDAR